MKETKSQWLERMTNQLGLDADEILEVADVFVETSGDYLKTLKECRTADEEAVRAAHTLKGSAANLGLDELSDTARLVELDLRRGEIPSEIINRLIEIFEDFQEFL